MTPMWHDGPLETLAWDGVSPVVWRVAQDGHEIVGAQVHDRRRDRRRLASVLIGRQAGVAVDSVRLERSDAGAPIVISPGGWHLGLSSRGSHCLIGVATAPIAVDRELLDGAAPLWDMLTQAGTRDLRRMQVAMRPREWLRRWTIKEAHAKLVGQPRRIAPEAIVIDSVHATAQFEGYAMLDPPWPRRDRNGRAVDRPAD